MEDFEGCTALVAADAAAEAASVGDADATRSSIVFELKTDARVLFLFFCFRLSDAGVNSGDVAESLRFLEGVAESVS